VTNAIVAFVTIVFAFVLMLNRMAARRLQQRIDGLGNSSDGRV
jgi:hypothetical protein